MKIIVFDIKGRFAHYRKFYTNSSSLTYGIPPRTTISGMVAGILGFERDSYYEELSSKKLLIGIKKLNSTKKLLQTLNYVKATSMSELINPKEHTQVPFEILVGDKNVGFRIYLANDDSNLLNTVEDRIKNNRFVYPPYLGSVNFGCTISYIDTLEGLPMMSKDFVSLSTAIRSDDIKDIEISNYSGRIIKERMPVDFSEDRIIKEVGTYIYDDDGKPINVKILKKYIQLSNGENIIFM